MCKCLIKSCKLVYYAYASMLIKNVSSLSFMRLSQGFWGTGETGHLFQGNKGQILRGTGEQRQYWGTGNIRKQIFDFKGTGEQANLFQGNKGTGTPPGRASFIS